MSGEVTPEEKLAKVEGTVERVTFHNSENGFSVLKVKRSDSSDLMTLVGQLSSVTPGENIVAWGEWIHNRDYGQQFKAKRIRLVPPSTLDGLEKYLGSGLIKGIGPHLASEIVKTFGDKVFDIIENAPSQLITIEKIGPKRAQMIVASWRANRIIRDIMIFLQSHGVSTSKALRIFKTYGERAIEKVKENPYQLARDIPGIGFNSADFIASSFGIDRNSTLRARTGLAYVLSEKVHNGHCAYPRDHLLRETKELLGIEESPLNEALDLEIQAGNFIEEDIETFSCLYPQSLFETEKSVARLIASLKKGPTPWPFPDDLDSKLHTIEKKLNISLAPLQKLAVHSALTNKICVITGGPGTGKSTLTKALVEYLEALGVRITLCSPTGRAAKRLSQCTGKEAKTIHRLLEYEPFKKNFKYNEDNHLDTDFILVDEASMVDIELANALLKSIPPHSALVIVGDVDQLPSVGPGQFLTDLIASETLPVITLTHIFRQASESQIIQISHKINKAEMPDLSPHRHSDFFFLETGTSEATTETILDLIQHRLPSTYHYNPFKDIQVLCPMYKGEVGARHLNAEIQRILNGNPVAKIERFGYSFGIGDKVMVTENDYGKNVYNGDIGFIDELNLEDQTARINIDDRTVDFDFSDLELLQPAYAITIHKSQGSEFPVVILPLVTEHTKMLQKNLVYTGITRGKKLVVVVGQRKALNLALKNSKKQKRWTNLKARLIKLQ